MNWEMFTEWLTNVTNNPAFISIASVLSVLGSVLLVISKTSFGRKAIKQLSLISEASRAHISEVENRIKEKSEEIDAKIAEFNEDAVSFKEEMEERYKVFFNQFDFYETQIFEILELIPNEKVKAKLATMKEEWLKKKSEIQEFIGISYSEFESKMDELQKQIEELKDGREKRINNETEEE